MLYRFYIDLYGFCRVLYCFITSVLFDSSHFCALLSRLNSRPHGGPRIYAPRITRPRLLIISYYIYICFYAYIAYHLHDISYFRSCPSAYTCHTHICPFTVSIYICIYHMHLTYIIHISSYTILGYIYTYIYSVYSYRLYTYTYIIYHIYTHTYISYMMSTL